MHDDKTLENLEDESDNSEENCSFAILSSSGVLKPFSLLYTFGARFLVLRNLQRQWVKGYFKFYSSVSDVTIKILGIKERGNIVNKTKNKYSGKIFFSSTFF